MAESFDSLIRSFVRSLRARNLSEKTVKTYKLAADELATYAAGQDLAGWQRVDKGVIEDHLGALARTRKPGGVSVAYRSLQQFFKWADEEGEVTPNPMARMRPPIVPEPETPVLREGQIRALYKACEGTDFRSRRDMAIVRFFLDTGVRLEECAGLTLGQLDVDMCEALVMGKGRRARTVAFGKRTVVALDRYLRVRARHKHGGSDDLWLAERTGPVGGAMTGDGIYQMLRRRGEQIDVPWLRPHILRHTWAHFARLEGRLHDDELQRLAGWRSRQMLARYSASAASERALSAGKRSALGDRL
jgi:site-specific recombinase XerD